MALDDIPDVITPSDDHSNHSEHITQNQKGRVMYVFSLVVQSELLLAATEMEDETHDAVVWSWRKESRHSRINAVGGQGAGSSAQVSI